MKYKIYGVLLGTIALIIMPLIGGLSINLDPSNMLNFKVGVDNGLSSFDWTWFTYISLFGAISICVLMYSVITNYTAPITTNNYSKIGFMYGAILLFTWFAAWTDFASLEYINKASFPILWISFVFLLSTITMMYKKKSDVLKLNNFILLFFFSIIFWWYFEFLNQFTANWNYGESEDRILDLSPLRAISTSIAFATVLLGEIAVLELFSTLCGYVGKMKITSVRISRKVSLVVFIGSAGLLALLPIYPQELFPILWTAPLLVMLAAQGIISKSFKIISFGEAGLMFMISASALSSLICGFFWEMWNYYNNTGWYYTIPHVDDFKVFEMPILGYLGYLPFGIECMLFVALILSLSHRVKAQKIYISPDT